MEKKRNSFRDTLSLLLSVCLHGSAVAVIVLGPSYFANREGSGLGTLGSGFESAATLADNSFEVVEFTVPETTETVAAAAPAPQEVAVVKAKPVVSNQLPEKAPEKEIEQNITTEPVIVVEEVAAAEDVAVVAEEMPVIQEQIQAEEVVSEQATETVAEETTTEVVEVAKVTEEKMEEKQNKVIPPPLADTPTENALEIAKPLQQTAETTAATATATAGTGTANDSNPTPAVAGTGILQSQQRSYLSLKQIVGNEPPRYSREMRIKKLEGRGELVCFVNKSGQITDVRIAKTTGHKELDDAAIRAFSKYRFEPNQEGHTSFPFEFTLKGPAKSDSGRLRTSSNQ